MAKIKEHIFYCNLCNNSLKYKLVIHGWENFMTFIDKKTVIKEKKHENSYDEKRNMGNDCDDVCATFVSLSCGVGNFAAVAAVVWHDAYDSGGEVLW